MPSGLRSYGRELELLQFYIWHSPLLSQFAAVFLAARHARQSRTGQQTPQLLMHIGNV